MFIIIKTNCILIPMFIAIQTIRSLCSRVRYQQDDCSLPAMFIIINGRPLPYTYGKFKGGNSQFKNLCAFTLRQKRSLPSLFVIRKIEYSLSP